MHKHRKFIMLFVILFIGLPFIFLFPGSGSLGRSGGGQLDASFPVAQVGSVPVTAEDFLNQYNRVTQARSQGGLPISAADLVNDGTVESILDSLIQQAVVTSQTTEGAVNPELEYLTVRLQEDPFFNNSEGVFDAGFYNQWVNANRQRGINWDSIYANVSDRVNTEVYLELLGASARVFDKEIRKEFESTRMQLSIKAAAIEPKVELSEEDLQKQYDDNLASYMTQEERRSDYIALSKKPPRPDILNELVARARAGEDFAELAREHSESLDKAEGGDIGWFSEEDELAEDIAPLKDLAVGEVSEAIDGVDGFHIYTVDEERTNDEGQREFHARKITLRPELSEEALEAMGERAEELYLAVVEAEGDIEAVGLLEDLDVQSSGLFSRGTNAIDNIPASDTYTFAQGLSSLDLGAVSQVIDARENVYIAVVSEIVAPAQKSLEEARENVERDAIALYKNGPDYVAMVADYASVLQEELQSLDQIQELYPELEVEIKETEAFKLSDYLFTYGLLFDTRQIFQMLLDKEPGDIIGPIRDLGRVTYFIELVERIPPEQAVWDDEYEGERERLSNSYRAFRSSGRRSDYLLFLTEQATNEALVQKDYGAIFSLLGLDDTGAEPEVAGARKKKKKPSQPAPKAAPEESTQEEIVIDFEDTEE